MSIQRKLLLDILSIPSPSGYEDTLIQFIHDFAQRQFKNIKAYIDSGELYLVRLAQHNPQPKTILYDAHIDQVSCRVMRITDDGFIIARCFGINESDIVGKPIQIITENGLVDGVITMVPPHLKIKDKTIYIDIFVSNREDAQQLVEIGDPIFFPSVPKIIRDNIIGSGLDNHIGVFCLLELAGKVDNLADINNNIIIHFSRREEVGGLKYINMLDDFSDMPRRIDLVIVVDAEIANDVPSINLLDQPQSSINAGPIISRNLTDDHIVSRYLKKIAVKNGIPYQLVMSDGDGGSNLEQYIQLSALGQFVGIPLRNMHSTVETASINDLANTIELLYSAFTHLDLLFFTKEK